MDHYSMENWVDFARGVVGAREKTAMQSHLDTGCKQCSKALNLWKHVHQVARQETALAPPEGAVRQMKAAIAIHGSRRPKGLALATAKLLFDSGLSPGQVGVRSSGSAARQLLFGVGTYRIDLRMEPQLDSDKVAVIGQVLHSNDPREGLGALPVALVKGRKVVAETVTSQFGEFNLECNMDGHFHLRVKLPSEELQLALVDPILPPSPILSLPYDSKMIKGLLKKRKKRNRGTQ
ncbi:MAG TPA: hypothetical protein VN885_07380 [Candidatus Acidoferrales bacterium]|nr:hypothetical protein [Candidatus Acidoferrales bacterium]